MEVKSNLTAVKNHYSEIWQAETCIQSLNYILWLSHKYIKFNIQISSNLVIVNEWFSVLFLPSHFKVSKTSYLIRLSSKLLKFEILALCFWDWNRYFYQDSKSLSSICLNWEIMFVPDELSRATWNRS